MLLDDEQNKVALLLLGIALLGALVASSGVVPWWWVTG